MTRDLRSEVFRHFAIPSVAFLALLALAPHQVVAQTPIWPQPREPQGPDDFDLGPYAQLKTSLKGGPLQKRLKAAFPESFRKGVDILWGPTRGWVSPDVFDWWAYRTEREGLTWEGAQQMFSVISGRSPVFSKPRDRQLCAVVGASRNLRGSRYGELIDGHDVVFRVNRAPTAEFEVDVGGKTTHHVMWPTALGPEQADRRAFLLMTPVTLHSKDVFGEILSLVEEGLPWEPSRVRIIHPEFIKYVHEDWMDGRGQFPSTGFIALMIAVHVCDEVDVFGFGANADGWWDRYYEDHVEKPSDLHPAEVEERLRQDMEEKGILKVFLGSRSAAGVEFSGFAPDGSEHD